MAGRRREQAGGDAIAIAAVCARGFYRGEREEPPSDKVNVRLVARVVTDGLGSSKK